MHGSQSEPPPPGKVALQVFLRVLSFFITAINGLLVLFKYKVGSPFAHSVPPQHP